MRDKRAKFVELANKRVNAAIKAVRLVGNLGNRSNYDYTDEDARKMMRTLQRELDAAKAKFGDGSDSVSGEFRL